MERKNGWQLAEAAGDARPDGMQDFLARMRWDADAVRDDLRAYVMEHLGDPGAVLVLDETGFVKKGRKSAGVQRQHSGTAGRIENCQIGVFLAYASRHGRALIDRALYLPESWAGDPGRREEAGVPCAWVTGDSVYGADPGLRRAVEDEGRGYVLAVTSAQPLGPKPVTDWLEDVPPRGWKRLSAGDGAKGPRWYDWAWLSYSSDTAQGWKKGLLIRRKLATPDRFTFYLTLAPEQATLADLVRVAGTRWTIEACFEQARGETGLDQHEVRSWTGWHRHITFAMLAHACLAALRRAAVGGRAGAGPRGRAAPAHRAGGAPAAVATGLGASTRTAAGAGLVPLAAPSSAASTALPLATANRGG